MHIHVLFVDMSNDFEDQVVVITGGGGGIGKAAARRFLDEGARLVLSGTRAEKLEAAAARAGRHALTKNLALELAPERIRVNTVALAFVETPAYERFMTPDEAEAVLESV